MDLQWKAMIERQLEASLNMFEDVLKGCPENLWTASLWVDESLPAGLSDFWYVAYHTLFWLDLYLGGEIEGFQPISPFDLSELDPAGLLPGRVYQPEELLEYLEHCRTKSRAIFKDLSDEQAGRLCKFSWGALPFAELLLDIMRHVQEHGAQLRMFLGQQARTNSRWLVK